LKFKKRKSEKIKGVVGVTGGGGGLIADGYY